MESSPSQDGAVFLLHKSPFDLSAANASPAPALVIPKDFVPTAESSHQLYQVDVEAFAGPLDLLLFLIKRHEIDIFDIPIAFLCERYVACLRDMEDLSLDVAGEFMFIASELLHIKSRLILPQPDSEDELAEEEDPRAALVARLLEYQKYQAAAASLDERHRLGRDVFTHPSEPLPPVGLAALREISIFTLVHAFNGVLKRQKPEVRHQVIVEQVSVHKRMQSLAGELAVHKNLRFADLVAGMLQRVDIVVTFLAVLELTRLKLLRLVEGEAGELFLQPRFSESDDVAAVLGGKAQEVDDSFT